MATASPNWLCERSRCKVPSASAFVAPEALGDPTRCPPHRQRGRRGAVTDGGVLLGLFTFVVALLITVIISSFAGRRTQP
jgi:hypothetical protein